MRVVEIDTFAKKISKENPELVVHWAISHKQGVSSEHYGQGEVKLFDIASISKFVQTTYLLMILEQKSMLSIEQTLGDFGYLGDYSKIQLNELLWHTSGLEAWWPFYMDLESRSEFKDYINEHSFAHKEQKGKRVYSDINFLILGDVLERITHKRLDELFDEYIRKPLKLCSTFYAHELKDKEVNPTSFGNPIEKILMKNLSLDITSVSWRERRLIGEVNDYNCAKAFAGVSGHCGLFSNSEDLLIIGNSILNNELVSRETTELFMNNLSDGNALGVLADPGLMYFNSNENCRGHHGYTGCTFLIDFKEGSVMSFLTNRQVLGLQGNLQYLDWKLR